MAILFNSNPSFSGTNGEDIIENFLNGDQTVFGLGGNDVIYGDMPQRFTSGGSSIGTAVALGAPNFGISMLENPDVAFSSVVPYATIVSTELGGNSSWFKVDLQVGQTITIDVDYGDDQSNDVDTWVQVVGPDMVTQLDRNDDNPNPDFHGSASGPAPQYDSYLEFTASTTGTHYIEFSTFSGSFAPMDDYIAYVSIPGEPLSASLFVGNDELYGGSGEDTVHGQVGNDRVFGGMDDDVVTGGSGEDIVSGGPGDDLVKGGLQSDMLTGDAGHDEIIAGGGKDTASGGEGRDTMFGQNGRDVMSGNGWNDELYGQSAADRLFGGVGKDTVNGGGGDDVLRGGDGRDRMIGGDGDDVLHGDAGEDHQFGRDGDDILNGNANDDKLNGQAGADRLFGGGGDDTITGGGGADFLKGGAGSDRLNGGDGSDTLEGGNGTDEFVFKNIINGQRDVIEDFQDGLDTLVFKSGGNLTYQAHAQGVLVTTPNGFEVLVKGWNMNDVDSGDFDFI